MKVESREYKLLVKHELFAAPSEAATAIWNEIQEAMSTVAMVKTKGAFDDEEKRNIVFLDTIDHMLRRHGLVLRLRTVKKGIEYTLKCRSEDRYFAGGTNVHQSSDFEGERKFEEDIAPPFRCRFSHSVSIVLPQDLRAALTSTNTLGEASKLYPVLGTLTVDGLPSAPKTQLLVVNDITVDETVWKGGKIGFTEESINATVALILWTRSKVGRPAAAELSFRIKDSEETFSARLADAARSVYTVLLRLDCARPEGLTKTEFIYRDAVID